MRRSQLSFFIIIGSALLLVAIGFVFQEFDGDSDNEPTANDTSVATMAPTMAPEPLNVTIITAIPIEPWVSQAADQFNADNRFVNGRPVQVEVIPQQGLAALNKWSRGEFDPVPTAWLAESRIWVDQANAAALDRTGQDIFLLGGQYRAQPIALSPIVWGVWEDTYQTLSSYFDTEALSWDELHTAAIEDDWSVLGGDEEWGGFKLVVAHPTRDPAGLSTMVGAAGEYFDNPGVTTEELQDPEFLNWLADLFDTVIDFSAVGPENMLLFGRSNGDAGQMAETYLLLNMAGVVERWGQPLRIVYPDPLAWFDFPFAIYMGLETSAEEKQAALAFKEYLLSAEQQDIALEFGLRPACPDCPSFGGLLAEWQEIGVEEEIPSASRLRNASVRGLDSLTEWYIERYEE